MIIDLILNILFYLGITVLIVESEPIIILKRKLGFKEEMIGSEIFWFHKYSYFTKNKIYHVLNFITKLIYCNWCSSFWITLCISFDFKLAVITSFVMWSIEQIRK